MILSLMKERIDWFIEIIPDDGGEPARITANALLEKNLEDIRLQAQYTQCLTEHMEKLANEKRE